MSPDAQMNWSTFLAEMSRPNSLAEMNWPNFFVVGPHKTGSTSVYTHLKHHPEVFLAETKQLRIFQPEHKDNPGLDVIRTMYSGAKGYKAIGEVAPDYFLDPAVPPRIREVCPDAKIVITLRDPVERAYSHYLHFRRMNREPADSFREALWRYDNRSAKDWKLSQAYIEQGLYSEHVRGYLDSFGRDQVLVPLIEDLEKNPNEFMAQIARHIGVDHRFFEEIDLSEHRNPYHMWRIPGARRIPTRWARRWLPRSVVTAVRPIFLDMKKPSLDTDLRRQLQELYEPDIARLEELLGQKLPDLRQSWV